MTFEVLFQDKNLRVLNKPANLSMLRDRSGEPNLWQQLQAEGEKPYLVHRLDKGTSGVLLVARNQATQSELTRAFGAQVVDKYYLAWVSGLFPQTGRTQRIDLPICKGRKSRYRIAGERNNIQQIGNSYVIEQDRDGLASTTLVRKLRQADGRSLLLLKPLSGRTHQIRVHLSWLGFALVGDHLYGKPNSAAQAANSLQLHCHKVVMPGWGSFTAPRPATFER